MNTNNIKMVEFIEFKRNCSADRVKKSNKLVRFKSKKECVFGELLTDFAFNKQYYIKAIINKDYFLLKNSLGKPFIQFRNERFWYSLSHSGGIISTCVNEFFDVGIDIQSTRTNIKNSHYIFSNLEIKDNIENKFNKFKLWSMKEAVSKLTGQGLKMNFEKINFSKIDNDLYLFKNIYVKTKCICFNSVPYFLSIATYSVHKVKYLEVKLEDIRT
ncbi:hypothetical protein AKUH3B209X_PPKS00110 (plasmid) [Apilactobacillus kunkeei]|uniref:4'-phosphopantetheinyl transferase family protein n=1 Tax=Apilactobacillus waqarii TaxID=2851006 RepID=UPI0021E2AE89|nr:hypothetical protein AKUH4B403J_PPKS00110 [Apilactobacillus kunkeei]CAI2672506.1 hypothetical protein AKUH4B103J_PPKS00110 [Apilactobacillus kunkeei]CAI2673239.1 hypothetical protein AKUH4B203M_PPKS00110 [Apilactobacillus kunkeei]CAI2674902.1 hypothetical protein AKUH4B116J_PPKS00110 [Apilactobacillus kunkeei]CAI2675235.1 hypothetical protein AKUH4B303J_PPKS00110 [Apilactobacillus kunkeei]